MSFFDEIFTENIHSAAIVGHVRPDGDCAGSVTGLWHYIRDNYPYVQADPYLSDLPDNLLFLCEDTPVLSECEDRVYDICICLDCSDEERIGAGKEAYLKAKSTLCVDHHKTNPLFCQINRVEGDISSTCELLTELCETDKIRKASAMRFYTGILHDTGCFQYDCTTSKTYRTAADLIDKGVDFSRIIRESFTMKSFKEIKLISDVIGQAVYVEDASFLYAMAPLDFQKEHGVSVRDLGAVVSSLNEIRGAEVVLFIYQLEDLTWKGSLRSKEKADVSAIASFFGGGGHEKAAGFSVADQPEKAIETVISMVSEQLKKL